MDWGVAWVVFFLVVVLKIPVAAAAWLIYYAARAVPDAPERPPPRDIPEGSDPDPPTPTDRLGAEAVVGVWTEEIRDRRRRERLAELARQPSSMRHSRSQTRAV